MRKIQKIKVYYCNGQSNINYQQQNHYTTEVKSYESIRIDHTKSYIIMKKLISFLMVQSEKYTPKKK